MVNNLDNIESLVRNCKTIPELTSLREEQYRYNRGMGDNFDFTKELYREPTHFTYELIQNADNAKAKHVYFKLEKNRLVFSHDGPDVFKMKNVVAITGIQNSTNDGFNTVGKFGLGFKSVFAVTKRPEVYSGDYNFAIERLMIPYELPPIELEKDITTKFIIPFENEKYSNAEIYEMLVGNLSEIDISTIMFLYHVQSVHIDIDGEVSDIILTKKRLSKGCFECYDPDDEYRFLLFQNSYQNGNKHAARCSIAYQLDQDNCIVEPENYPYVSVFLPTRTFSEMNLIVDAPFKTPPDREKINYGDKDAEHEINNVVLIENLQDLFKISVIGLRDMGYLTSDALAMLPIEKGDNENYLAEAFYDSLIELMNTEPCIPTTDGNFTIPSEAFIPVDSRIARFTSSKNKKWAEVHSGNLRTYYKDILKIPSYNLDSLLEEIKVKDLKEKDETWLYDFYSYIDDEIEYWSAYSVRQKPIIKTRTNSFIAAKIGKSNNIFLPQSKGVSNAKIVHQMLTTESQSIDEDTRQKMKSFLSKMDIHERFPKDTIKLTILNKWEKANTSERIELFKEIAKIYNASNQDEKYGIINLLQKRDDILLVRRGNKSVWSNPDAYMNDSKLQSILDGIDDAAFIDPRIWTEEYEETTNRDGEATRRCLGTNELCLALGVRKRLTYEKFNSCYHDSTYTPNRKCIEHMIPYVKLNASTYWVSETCFIKSFAEILSNMDSIEKCKHLIFALSEMDDYFYKAELWVTSANAYSKNHGADYEIPSDCFVKLYDFKWPTKNPEKTVLTKDLFREEFVKLYGLSGDEKALDYIIFKNDARKNLDTTTQNILDIIDKYNLNEEQLKELGEKLRAEQRSDGHKEEIDEAIVDFGEIGTPTEILDTFIDAKDIDETVRGSKVGDETTVKSKTEDTSHKVSKSTKATGDLYERIAMKYLADEYKVDTADHGESWREFTAPTGETIKHLGGNHEGYDIEVRADDEIIRRIEVKPFVNGRIDGLSENEWNYAKKFEDTYEIFRVKHDQSGENGIAVTKNLYKRCRDGEIEVIPGVLRFVQK